EALLIGVVGAALGLLFGAFASRSLLTLDLLTAAPGGWLYAAALFGVFLSLFAILIPAWWDARHLSVTSARVEAVREGAVSRPHLLSGLILLALSVVVFWRTAATGYQLVLAPEGVAAVSIDYGAFLAPFLFWLGMG